MSEFKWQSIWLDGIPTSKKNGKRIVGTKGRGPMLLSSSAYLKWEKASALLMRAQLKPVESCSLHVTFWLNDKKKFDLDNKLTSIMDCLVKSGVIPDDNWGVVHSIQAEINHHCDETVTMISIGGVC